jgi:hypothetical protein
MFRSNQPLANWKGMGYNISNWWRWYRKESLSYVGNNGSIKSLFKWWMKVYRDDRIFNMFNCFVKQPTNWILCWEPTWRCVGLSQWRGMPRSISCARLSEDNEYEWWWSSGRSMSRRWECRCVRKTRSQSKSNMLLRTCKNKLNRINCELL